VRAGLFHVLIQLVQLLVELLHRIGLVLLLALAEFLELALESLALGTFACSFLACAIALLLGLVETNRQVLLLGVAGLFFLFLFFLFFLFLFFLFFLFLVGGLFLFVLGRLLEAPLFVAGARTLAVVVVGAVAVG